MQFPKVGKKLALDKVVKDTESPLTVRLYSNDISPSDDDTSATYTEVTGGGYAGIALVGADWTTSSASPSVSVCEQKSFLFTGAAGNIYGYFVTNAEGTLFCAERFPAVRTINYADEAIKVRLTINADQLVG